MQTLIEALETVDARCVIVGFGDDREQFEAQAAGQPILFTGALEHRHLTHLAPLADVSVVPSIFPEAFGMVAEDGRRPAVRRSWLPPGLAEIADGLRRTTRVRCGTWRASPRARRASSRRS